MAAANGLIVVAIPTYRRPVFLQHLIEALIAQDDAPRFTVLVADNDAARCEGVAVIEAMRGAAGMPTVEAFVVVAKGLCTVRNALLTRALAVPGMTAVALIDDDEWPDPGWLAALAGEQARSGADAVGGPVQARFVGPAPRWSTQTFLFRPERRTAGPAPIIWGANNALLTRACLEAGGSPWFDAAFNQIGGEDVDLFTRWRADGRRFAWAPDAWVNEWVLPERATLRWVLRRMWRIGNTDTMVKWKRSNGARRAMLVLRTAAYLGFAALALPLAALPGGNRIDHLGRLARAFGRVAGLVGRPYREYL